MKRQGSRGQGAEGTKKLINYCIVHFLITIHQKIFVECNIFNPFSLLPAPCLTELDFKGEQIKNGG